ncbi:sensor histidine kinase [Streptomyces sp. DSM 44917]|uniref:histidine kinase n=1 Tax=Streptomyces boetiae TaxID=3075541 RepID=A0ABU2L470_9ACTN|nr:sensor histidine kinase [Streptomyces sp. DSM 44917]MDT0306361.1 sensor histidine kinase [Streptomyces sp. DSM 44917]
MDIPAALVASLSAGSGLALMLVVVLAVREPRLRRERVTARHRAEHAEAHLAGVRGELAAIQRRERLMAQEVEHLASTRLPAVTKALRHPHVKVPGPLHPDALAAAGGPALDTVLAGVSEAVLDERRRVDGAARAAMRGATTKLQTMCYQMQSAVDDLLHKYDDPELAERLAALDYLNEQILRRLQVTRVVCGAGAGLVRTKAPLRALVLGASSRIPGYERVQIVDHLPQPVAVVDRAAEPVAIVVAELLANAVHHSHGSLPVEVTLHRAHNGAVVVINDAGIGMNADEFRLARTLLAGTEEVALAELGDPPRSGFAAIGELSRQYGIGVSVEPSHYAGVKAVVFIPTELLTSVSEAEDRPLPAPAPASRPSAGPGPDRVPDPAGEPAGAPAARAESRTDAPTADVAPLPPAHPEHAPAAEEGAGDPPPLPQRRHRRAPDHPVAHAEAPEAPEAPDAPRVPGARPPEEAAARMGALQRGTARGRAEGRRDPGVGGDRGPHAGPGAHG